MTSFIDALSILVFMIRNKWKYHTTNAKISLFIPCDLWLAFCRFVCETKTSMFFEIIRNWDEFEEFWTVEFGSFTCIDASSSLSPRLRASDASSLNVRVRYSKCGFPTLSPKSKIMLQFPFPFYVRQKCIQCHRQSWLEMSQNRAEWRCKSNYDSNSSHNLKTLEVTCNRLTCNYDFSAVWLTNVQIWCFQGNVSIRNLFLSH